jgi:multicomponent Na+:H+ antiporter subunit F
LSGFLLGVCIALLVGALMALYRALAGPTVFDRILAVNSAGTKTVVIVALLGFFGEPGFYIDTALAYALINFLATIAILRYIKHRRIG